MIRALALKKRLPLELFSSRIVPVGLAFVFLLSGFSIQCGHASHQKNKKGHERRVVRGNAPCLAWVSPDLPVKAVILCVHGLGLHNGSYEAFGKQMSKRGFAVYAIDVRGFGSWMEAQGREKVDFSSCLEDVRATLKVVRRAHLDKAVFLLGESMGGAIVLKVTASSPALVDGLISSVSAADRYKQTKPNLKVALHLLNDPDKPINVGAAVIKQATQKADLRQAWLNDPLARLNLSERELWQFDKFMKGNKKSARKIRDKPVLIVQGSRDKLVKPEGTVDIYNELTAKDKKIVLIPNGEHLIFEEAQFGDGEKEIIEIVASGLDNHLERKTE